MICRAILVASLMFLATGRFSKTFAMPTCLNRCGDLTIPFPFGISSDCSLDDSFLISCNMSYNPPKPFLKSGLVVLNISLDGLMRVESSVASDCYDDSGSQIKSNTSELTSSNFLISSRLNKFTAIGCDTYALRGDGKKGGEGCHSKKNDRHSKKEYSGSAFLYIASGLMIPAFGSSWILWRRKQKKVDRLRSDLFHRNGGHLVEGALQFFRAEDLKRATNNYDENNAVSGSVELYGGVAYRAVLLNGSQAIVVKYDAVEECNIEVFINNIITLSELYHVNIVQLLGCCLETQVPLLVFEHFENKTVYDYIHNVLPWDIRLKIASEIARALEYMHQFSNIQVIHGHLSSSSITLDDDGLYTVKMHNINFNYKPYPDASFSVTAFLYLDPQYFLRNDSTPKSDVYSFGVILAEMLTGQTVMSRYIAQGEESLVQYFLNGSDNLDLILDSQLESGDWIDKLTPVAALAKTCLSYSPMDRPTMAEVANVLTAISGP